MFNNTNRWLRPDDWTTPLYRTNFPKVSKVFLSLSFFTLQCDILKQYSCTISLGCNCLFFVMQLFIEHFVNARIFSIVQRHPNSCKSQLHKIVLLSKSLFPQFFNLPVKLFSLFATANSFDRAQNCSDPICCLFIAFFFFLSNFSWELTLQCQVVFFSMLASNWTCMIFSNLPHCHSLAVV